jgi:alcohol dehydrogenase
MDCAKAISFIAKQEKNDYWYYLEHPQETVHEWLPVITIPTDAGTGSESDPFFNITNEDLFIKRGFPGAKQIGTFPVFTIDDPELTISVPRDYTAYQGIDTLFHSIEGYIAKQASALTDMYCLTCIENAYKYLPIAVNDGSNLEAREMIAFCNNLSSIVIFTSATASQHSLEHAMSAYHFELAHGAGMLMICRAYFSKIIEKHCCDDRFIKMAQVMGMKEADKPEDFLVMLEKLLQTCGVDDLKMSDYGITRTEFPKFVENARRTMAFGFMSDRCELTDEDCIEIYERSYK